MFRRLKIVFIRVDIPPLEDIPDVKIEVAKPSVVRQVQAPPAGSVLWRFC